MDDPHQDTLIVLRSLSKSLARERNFGGRRGPQATLKRHVGNLDTERDTDSLLLACCGPSCATGPRPAACVWKSPCSLPVLLSLVRPVGRPSWFSSSGPWFFCTCATLSGRPCKLTTPGATDGLAFGLLSRSTCRVPSILPCLLLIVWVCLLLSSLAQQAGPTPSDAAEATQP